MRSQEDKLSLNNVRDEENNNPDRAAPAAKPETDRRELIQKLGRFTAYAAPLTVLLLTSKAKAYSGPP